MTRSHWFEVGRIVAAHGIRGGLKVLSYTDPAEALLQYEQWWLAAAGQEPVQSYRLRHSQLQPNNCIAYLDGIEDRNQAETLLKRGVYVSREQADKLAPADPDSYYQADLLALRVLSSEGVERGRVVRLHPQGGYFLLEIARPDNPLPLWIPFVDEHVAEVNVAAGYVVSDFDAL